MAARVAPGELPAGVREAPLLTWLKNSLIYAVLATGFMLLSSVPAAYALARLRWRGRNLVLLAVIIA